MSGGSSPSRVLRYQALLPVGQVEAFAFVSDPRNWSLFLDGLEVLDVADDWGALGSRARTEVHLLGRAVTSDLEITHWDPPRVFRYTARHRGRPPVENVRTFEPTEGGTRFAGTTSVTPRAGYRGVTDLVAMRALHRTYLRGMALLPVAIVRR